MSDPHDAESVADHEAAEWHVRLGERPVSAATLDEFKLWRRTPGNADAYRRLEVMWRASGDLSRDADIQALTRETLQASRPETKTRRRLALVPALVGALVVAMGGGAVWLWMAPNQTYATAVGEQRLVRLDDGSQVRLDTDSRLKVEFANAERRVVLERGQAMFTVAHDAKRPFQVQAGRTEVTALGTRFDVRREASGAQVTLVDGVVKVTDGASRQGRQWRLSPGQQIRTARPAAAPHPVDAAVATSWTEGRLIFRGAPLSEAVAEVNRYLPDKIVLASPEIGATPVNGVFAAGDRDAFVSAVSDLFQLSARRQADGTVRLVASSAGG